MSSTFSDTSAGEAAPAAGQAPGEGTGRGTGRDAGPATASRTRARDGRIDIARGIAMVLVVLGHAIFGVLELSGDNPVHRFELLALYSSHMALFFIISGMLAGPMVQRGWAAFAEMALKRILWPYVLWSAVLKVTHWVMGSYVNEPQEGLKLLNLLWQPPGVMWFLYVLLVGMVILRLTRALPRPAVAAVALVLFATSYLLPDLPPVWLTTQLRFVALYLVAALVGRDLPRYLLHPAVLGVSALVMVATLAYAWQDAQGPLVGYPAFAPAYIPALVAGPALLLWLAAGIDRLGRGGGGLGRLLNLVGRRTMPIFVTHVLLTAGSRIALTQLGVTEPAVLVVAGLVTGVALPLIAVEITDRLGLSPYLGWR